MISSVFEKLFTWNKTINKNEPQIRFGRFSDAYKTQDQLKYMEKSIECFANKQYIDAYTNFFLHLNDEKEQNVSIEININNEIAFSLIQGSQKIIGIVNQKVIKAKTEVAKFDTLSVSFMRKLLTENSNSLQYSRFAIHQNTIFLLFDSPIIDASPQKLYFALKELSTFADKHDDLLIDSFSMLNPINSSPIFELPEIEKKTKIKYLKKWINNALEISKQNVNKKIDGGISYVLLSTAFKIDYFILPQGKLTEQIEEINEIYFAINEESTADRNEKIMASLDKIINLSDSSIEKQLYGVKATFGILTPIKADKLSELIEGELKNIGWYIENKYDLISNAIIEYIIFYTFFLYDLDYPIRDTLKFLAQLLNKNFVQELGYKDNFYLPNSDKLNVTEIKEKLKLIEKNANNEYKNFKLNTSRLNYSNSFELAQSLLLQIKKLTIHKK